MKRSAFLAVLLVLSDFSLTGRPSHARADVITIFGLQHTSLGQATLQVVNGNLVVGNIGPSGNDGVRVDLPFLPNFHEWIAQYASPINGTFRMTTTGVVNGTPNQTISTLTSTPTGNGFLVAANFPNFQGPFVANYFLNGNLVLAEDLSSVPPSLRSFFVACADGTCGPNDSKADIEYDCDDFSGPGGISRCRPPVATADVTYGRRPLSMVTTLGQNVIADTVQFSVNNLNNPGFIYTSVSLTASGVPSFTIASETITTVPEPATVVVFGCLACLGVFVTGRRKLGTA